MDNITHTLTAVMLSRAGLNRLSPHATALLALAANAPDLDILCAVAGPAILALLIAALAILVARESFSWGRAYVLALIGVASNPLLDWLNAYGVRLLWPFSERWFNADLFYIVDAWVWVLLALGLVVPWLSALVSSEIGAQAGKGRGVAAVVLCALSLYGFGRYLLHERAIAVLDSRIYQGEAARRVAAMPTAVNPFRWTGLVEGKGFYKVYPRLDLLEEFDPSEGVILYKPEPGPEIKRAAEIEQFRIFLGFAQWPLWSVTPVAEPEGGVKVKLVDLRFGDSGSFFAVSTILDAGRRVVGPSPGR
jgi:inner membrane protein